MDVKIQLTHKDSRVPRYSHLGDAAVDLVVVGIKKLSWFKIEYDFGIAVEVPHGFYGTISSRSSIMKHGIILSNGTGLIDASYRGSLKGVYYYIPFISKLYNIGDRAAQFMLHKRIHISFKKSKNLSNTERGSGGYGSTGK